MHEYNMSYIDGINCKQLVCDNIAKYEPLIVLLLTLHFRLPPRSLPEAIAPTASFNSNGVYRQTMFAIIGNDMNDFSPLALVASLKQR